MTGLAASPPAAYARTSESGVTLIETVIASTMITFVATILAASAGGFARNVSELREATDVLVEVQTARNRLMSDVADAATFICSAADVFRILTDGVSPPISTIEYRQTAGDLHRINTTTGLELTVAKDLAAIACTDAGGGELDVTMTFGVLDTQTRLRLRVTDAGVGP